MNKLIGMASGKTRTCRGDRIRNCQSSTDDQRLTEEDTPIDTLGPRERAEVYEVGSVWPRLPGAFREAILAFDNDRAGEQGWRKARDANAEWKGFQILSHSPKHKDWNEDLIQLVVRFLKPKQAGSLNL
jgi:hypothetical protein